MPKLGKAGSLQSRQAIAHSFAHTESWAIDLSGDIIAHFGKKEPLPREFFTDFVKVAQDEGRHFALLAKRLEEFGSFMEHCLLMMARGLDVLPTTISRFQNGGDNETAVLLESVVYPEEIAHCAAGVKWFKYLCLRSSDGSTLLSQESDEPNGSTIGVETEEVIQKFHDIVRTHFRGPLKPPFNEKARKAAGFGPQWYEPLALKEAHQNVGRNSESICKSDSKKNPCDRWRS